VFGAVTCISTNRSILGENPLWDDSAGCLFSIDCMGRKLLRHDLDGETQDERALQRTPGSVVLRKTGGLMMANRQGLAFMDFDAGTFDDIATPGIDFSREVFNDGKCDSQGRFWVGTMHRHVSEPLGALYRVDADLTVHRMAEAITLSNGIAWSPDDSVLYHCDSRPGRVWAFDYDAVTGNIANRRLHIDFVGRPGRPDGCTVDAAGGLWIAEIGAGRVVCFDPAGREVAAVPVPVSKPTSVAFGGQNLTTLFITSMRYGLSEEALAREPLAGGTFAVDVGVVGLPAARFAG
jgi:sugar lactone lactonase YvrE